MLTAERAKEVFNYCAETGSLTWRIKVSNKVVPGTEAGSLNTSGSIRGYRSVRIDKKLYLVHRVAWLYVHGRWPEGDLDHRDLDRANNAIENLRPATRAQNMWNTERPAANTSGTKGIYRDKRTGNFIARMRCNGKRHHVGVFATAHLAHAALTSALKAEHGEFARVPPLGPAADEPWVKPPRRKRPPFTDEHKAKLRAAKLGRTLSFEHRAAMSRAQKARYSTSTRP